MTKKRCPDAVRKRPSEGTLSPRVNKYGRLDADDDAVVPLLKAVMGGSSSSQHESEGCDEIIDEPVMDTSVESEGTFSVSVRDANHSQRTCRILRLPSELLDHIVAFLNPPELFSLARTCRTLHGHTMADFHWQRHVQENVPCAVVRTPYPCASFRDLYLAHDPHWFIPRSKIWFCDDLFVGKVILARYDPRRGCIEAYRLVAETEEPTLQQWEADGEVTIHSFNPTVKLHLDQPVLQLDAFPRELTRQEKAAMSPRKSSFQAEIPMNVSSATSHGIFSNLLLVKSAKNIPPRFKWPPPAIPTSEYVTTSQDENALQENRPVNRFEFYDQAFRIRRWTRGGGSFLTHIRTALSSRLDGDLHTYSTLDPKLYTPTRERPYRGIWVGDYAGHGCEFLLVHQPDNPPTPVVDDAAQIVDYEEQGKNESFEAFQARRELEKQIYRGRLEAIKLTGDPNVPRGECTFIVDDLGPKGFVRIAKEQNFKGARVVKSRGHIATRGFIDDRYIESELIMISPNKLAQYWVDFGHISFYERVNIDDFLRV